MPKAAFDPAAFIRNLEERCRGKNFLYRGQDEAYQPKGVPAGQLQAESTLRRDLLKAGMPVTEREIKKWEQRILVGARTRFPPHTADAEVWAALRHAGGMTNSIDFTLRLRVALRFAVLGDPKKDGVIFLLEDEGRPPKPASDHDILAKSSPPLSGGVQLVESSHTSDYRFRPQRQASVFVQAPEGRLSLPRRTHIIVISGKCKSALLDHLESSKHRLTHHNLFPDLSGLVALESVPCRQLRREDFARIYDNLENLLRHRNRLVAKGGKDARYLRGQVHYFRGDYVRALRDFSRATTPARSEPERGLHLFLNSTRIYLGEYQKAINELVKISAESRSDLEYYMLAEAYYQLARKTRNFIPALRNIERAIESNPHRPIYFRAQIAYEAAAGRYAEARIAVRNYRNAFQDDRTAHAMLAEINRSEAQATPGG